MNAHNKKLADFGRVVLEILENDVEWNSDTTDRLGNEAVERGLARTNNETGLFEACHLNPFPLGTLVKLHPPKPLLTAMTIGKVVPYRGRHDPKNPRVRWASGWGITSKASELIALTPEEIKQAPAIPVVDIDLIFKS